jgi:alkanesulfonate monooxygenase SsuD/methylene tetrahydromethanopterin reductase-like flavin-dependent oxidoreductase (luciferase family)
MSRAQFDASTTLEGANIVGSPQEVTEKLLYQHELFGHQRTLIQLTVGTLPHASVMRSIELLGTEVAPAVRQATARREAADTPA